MEKSKAPFCINGMALLIMIFIFIFTFIPQAHPSAFRNPDQGASAVGQSIAFVAQADDPSAIFYNPAGLTQLIGTQVSIGTTLIDMNTDFQSTTGAGSTSSTTDVNATPNFYISTSLHNRFAFGIGAFAPFGLQIEYPSDSPLRFSVTSAQLTVIALNPTVAYQLADKLAIGFGLDFYFANIDAESRVDFSVLGAPDGFQNFNSDTDQAIGVNAGLLYKPTDRLSLGIAWRSGTSFDLEGPLSVTNTPLGDQHSQAQVTLKLPQVVNGGMAYWPIKNQRQTLKVEFDLDWTDWESFDSLDAKLNSPIFPGTPFQRSRIPSPRNYNSTFAYRLGLEYRRVYEKQSASLRLGYAFDQTPVPNSTFDPTVPDADRHGITAGIGYNRGRFGIDLAYQIVIFKDRRVDTDTIGAGANPLTSPSLDGDYNSSAHIGAINITYRFP